MLNDKMVRFKFVVRSKCPVLEEFISRKQAVYRVCLATFLVESCSSLDPDADHLCFITSWNSVIGTVQPSVLQEVMLTEFCCLVTASVKIQTTTEHSMLFAALFATYEYVRQESKPSCKGASAHSQTPVTLFQEGVM